MFRKIAPNNAAADTAHLFSQPTLSPSMNFCACIETTQHSKKLQKVRRSDGEDRFGKCTEMLCTLRNWHHDEATLPHEALFIWNEQLPPEILLRPLPRFPSKLRNRSIVPSFTDKINYRVALTDIHKATVVVDACRVLLSLPHRTTLEIDCLTRNGCDLLGAALQSRLPPLRCLQERRETNEWPQAPVISPCSSMDDSSSSSSSSGATAVAAAAEYDVDALTSACMRATAAQESFQEKLQRRWGKAVHDLSQIMEGTPQA